MRMRHLFSLAHDHRCAAVCIAAEGAGDGIEGGRAVVLRPVELDAARDPRPGKADQSGLYDLVVIHAVIAVRLVVDALDAAADLRQYHYFEVIVFQKYRPVFLVDLDIGESFGHRMGIHAAGASLIDALFQKHGVFVRASGLVCGDNDRFFPYCCLLHIHNASSFLRYLVLLLCFYYNAIRGNLH